MFRAGAIFTSVARGFRLRNASARRAVALAEAVSPAFAGLKALRHYRLATERCLKTGHLTHLIRRFQLVALFAVIALHTDRMAPKLVAEKFDTKTAAFAISFK